MGDFWYAALAAMLIAYVVLDGFDFGAGIVHLVLARSERERLLCLRSIGPFWDGNEVWLIAAGGVLFFAFPTFYASAFSGFYLALMLFLWLLILRGVSIELRNHLSGPLWKAFFGGCFGLSSLAIAFLLGAALGNLIRGVNLGGRMDGQNRLEPNAFFAPLWTDFRCGESPGLIDWFTVLMGAIAVVALALHGAAWITLKSADPFVARLRVFQRRTWWTLALLLVASFAAVYVVRPDFFDLFLERLLARGLVPLAALGALAILPTWLARKAEGRVFVSSSLFIAGMLAATAIAIHPVLLRSTNPEHPDLTIAQAASPGIAQSAALGWWPLGLVLALAYLVFAHRTFKGKIAADENIYGGH